MDTVHVQCRYPFVNITVYITHLNCGYKPVVLYYILMDDVADFSMEGLQIF
jgi:hypothetical protein